MDSRHSYEIFYQHAGSILPMCKGTVKARSIWDVFKALGVLTGNHIDGHPDVAKIKTRYTIRRVKSL